MKYVHVEVKTEKYGNAEKYMVEIPTTLDPAGAGAVADAMLVAIKTRIVAALSGPDAED